MQIPGLRPLATRLEANRPRPQELDRELTAIHAVPGHFKWAVATEVTGRLLSTFEYTILLYALGLGFDPLRAYVVTNMASVLANILFFIPFEMGSKEGAYGVCVARARSAVGNVGGAAEPRAGIDLGGDRVVRDPKLAGGQKKAAQGELGGS